MQKPLLLLFVFFVLFCFSLISQNIVPNPSFEDYTICPNGSGQINKVLDWSSYGYSPDWFHTCGTLDFSVPQNFAGNQFAATGDAYVGFFTSDFETNTSLREYIGAKLISQLISGKKYNISFKTVFSEWVSCPNNNLGVFLSTISYSLDSICPPPCETMTLLFPKNDAHFYFDSIITDINNWTTISGSFIADSAYEFIAVGNFFDSTNTNYIDVGVNNYCYGYYIFDDISLTMDTDSVIDTTNIKLNYFEKQIRLFPNPVNDVLYISIDLIGEININCYNLFGEKIIDVHNGINPKNKKFYELSFSEQPSGYYALVITINNKTITKNIIINH